MRALVKSGRVYLTWEGGSWRSDLIRRPTSVAKELEKGVSEGRLSVMPSGELAYGKARLSFFNPSGRKGEGFEKALLAAVDRRTSPRVRAGVGCDASRDPRSPGYCLLVAYEREDFPGEPDDYWSMGVFEELAEAEDASISLVEALLGNSYPLDLCFEDGFRVDLGEGVLGSLAKRATLRPLTRFSWLDRQYVENSFEFLRMLSDVVGVFRLRWSFLVFSDPKAARTRYHRDLAV